MIKPAAEVKHVCVKVNKLNVYRWIHHTRPVFCHPQYNYIVTRGWNPEGVPPESIFPLYIVKVLPTLIPDSAA